MGRGLTPSAKCRLRSNGGNWNCQNIFGNLRQNWIPMPIQTPPIQNIRVVIHHLYFIRQVSFKLILPTGPILCTCFHIFILCKKIKRNKANTLINPTSMSHATSLSSTVWIARIVTLIKLHQQLFKLITQLLNFLASMQTTKASCNKVHFTLRIKYCC